MYLPSVLRKSLRIGRARGCGSRLLSARAAIEQPIADLDRKVMRLAGNNAQARQFMTHQVLGQSRLFASSQRSMILRASNSREASEPILD